MKDKDKFIKFHRKVTLDELYEIWEEAYQNETPHLDGNYRAIEEVDGKDQECFCILGLVLDRLIKERPDLYTWSAMKTQRSGYKIIFALRPLDTHGNVIELGLDWADIIEDYDKLSNITLNLDHEYQHFPEFYDLCLSLNDTHMMNPHEITEEVQAYLEAQPK